VRSGTCTGSLEVQPREAVRVPGIPCFSITVSITILLIAASPAPAVTWKELKDKHFIAYHTKDHASFARTVTKRSESYYKSIPKRLGITRFGQFWTWDNRVKIYLYPDRATFLNETKTPVWARALANYKKREIKSYKGHAGTPLVDGVLPHELAHLVLRDFIGLGNKAPLWLDEGVAQMMESGMAGKANAYVRKLLNTDNFMSVGTLTKLNIYRVRDKQLVNMFYMESCALVNYLIQKHGADKFYRFCCKLRDGKSLDDALKGAYSGSISNVDELNEQWKKSLKS
jgi:hypothetical protein